MRAPIAWEQIDEPPYKYSLSEEVRIPSGICPEKASFLPSVLLCTDGILIIVPGFRWDGASSVAIDTPNFMLPSCAHDALYLLMREGVLESRYRKAADKLLYRLCRSEGMPWVRAQYVYWAVRAFGWRGLRKRTVT